MARKIVQKKKRTARTRNHQIKTDATGPDRPGRQVHISVEKHGAEDEVSKSRSRQQRLISDLRSILKHGTKSQCRSVSFVITTIAKHVRVRISRAVNRKGGSR